VTYNSKDLIWLLERFGVAFDEVDYFKLARFEPTGEITVSSLPDVFDFDEDKYQQLLWATRSANFAVDREMHGE
jgi:hypothetical protein